MTDKLELAKSRAARAQALANDDLLKEAFTTLEAEYTEFWKATPVRDQDARERVWQAIQVIGKVKGHLQTIIDDGKIANKRIAELNDGKFLKVV